MIDWDNPEERYKLIEKIGADAYNKAYEEHIESTTVSRVGGHSIRPVNTRFGRLFSCGGTGVAYAKLKDAEDYCRTHPLESK